jgi:hypothetical protein
MIHQLKHLLTQKPFVPFQIVLTDRRRFDIPRFGRVAVGLTRFTLANDGGFVHLAEKQIADLKVLTNEVN